MTSDVPNSMDARQRKAAFTDLFRTAKATHLQDPSAPLSRKSAGGQDLTTVGEFRKDAEDRILKDPETVAAMIEEGRLGGDDFFRIAGSIGGNELVFNIRFTESCGRLFDVARAHPVIIDQGISLG